MEMMLELQSKKLFQVMITPYLFTLLVVKINKSRIVSSEIMKASKIIMLKMLL